MYINIIYCILYIVYTEVELLCSCDDEVHYLKSPFLKYFQKMIRITVKQL